MTRDKFFEKRTDEELIGDLVALYHDINVIECYGTGDIIEYFATMQELERRGYVIVPSVNVIQRERRNQ